MSDRRDFRMAIHRRLSAIYLLTLATALPDDYRLYKMAAIIIACLAACQGAWYERKDMEQ